MKGRIDCREASRRLSRRMEDPLELRQRLTLLAHLAVCPHCRAFSRQTRVIREAFRLLGRGEPSSRDP